MQVYLGGEGLVDLDLINLSKRDPGFLQHGT